MMRLCRFCVCCLIAFQGVLLNAQITVQDTVVPNVFSFSQSTYTVLPGATSIEITVLFQPGHRGFTGWVDYHTEDGTARNGTDYQSVTGRLEFAGVTRQSFHIPILRASADGNRKSFRVYLSNPGAEIWGSPATIVIEPSPSILLSVLDQRLVISWPAVFENCVLERAETFDFADAVEVKSPVRLVNGRWQVEEPASGTRGFYRLRTAPQQAPETE